MPCNLKYSMLLPPNCCGFLHAELHRHSCIRIFQLPVLCCSTGCRISWSVSSYSCIIFSIGVKSGVLVVGETEPRLFSLATGRCLLFCLLASVLWCKAWPAREGRTEADERYLEKMHILPLLCKCKVASNTWLMSLAHRRCFPCLIKWKCS